jgi:MoxR-like ATPase
MNWGAGPRGVLTLIACSKSRALLGGRHHATTDDVLAVARPALRHRIAGNYAAQAAGVSNEKLIDLLLEAVPADREYVRPNT